MAEPPTEAQIDRIGMTLAKSMHANTTLSFVANGIQLFMCFYGLAVFLETPEEKRRGRLPFIIISFVIFFLSTYSSIVESTFLFQMLFKGGPTGLSYLQTQPSLWDAHTRSWEGLSGMTAMLLYIFIGEFLLLYRCFIMWRHRWMVMIFPALTYLCSVATGIASSYPFPILSYKALGIVWTFTSVATNTIVTFLLVFRLVRARRDLQKAMPSATGTSAYSGTIAILVESAAPVTLFGIGSVIVLSHQLGMGEIDMSSAWVGNISAEFAFSALYYNFCAISPQMIIFRVTTGRSWASHGNDAASEVFSRPIQFTTARRGQGPSESISDSLSDEPSTPSKKESAGV